MSYILQEPTNFINMKLTDTGRGMLSLGALTFRKVVLSDREVDYSMGRHVYDICNNAILNPQDDQAMLPDTNYDGTAAVTLKGQNLGRARQIVSAMTDSTGFFTGSTNGFTIATNATTGMGKPLGIGTIDYSFSIPSGSTSIHFNSTTYTASTGDLVYIPWEPPQYSAVTNNTPQIFSGRPNVSLWYRVQSSSGNDMEVDRNVPNFGASAIPGSSQQVQAYFYPYNGIESFYGSSTTINTGVWNMNIVRTTSVVGTTTAMSGYTSYGSLEYNGTKIYLGFSSETKTFGIVHYTNHFTGNTYAEQLVPGTVQVDIPHIMWHRNSTESPVGTELTQGLTLYDVDGSIYTDSAARTTYRELKDAVSGGIVVGRVYHKLKTIIITDQELLAVLSYKSNRNYTLPVPDVYIQSNPSSAHPLQTGLCKSGKTYFVSYIASSDAYSNGASYGYPMPFHCTNYAVAPLVPDNTPSKFLKVEFPANSFPFMRNTANLDAFSGTGWNANKVQILVKEMYTSAVTTVGAIPTNGWVLISDGIGNGIYTGETGHATIDPVYLQAKSFVISQEDYNSGTTFSLSGIYSAFTSYDDISASGLTFGCETFFFGNIKTGIMSTVFKTVVTVYATNDQFNSSNNISFDADLDKDSTGMISTFITEIGILDSANNLVAVGKPSYPIKKNSSRFLAFQLELDF